MRKAPCPTKEKDRRYFGLIIEKNTWWFTDPDGNLFLSKGVNHVSYEGDYSPTLGYSPYFRNIMEKYGSVEKWVDVTVKRLKDWGFNTIGAWSSRELSQYLPYTVVLNVLAEYGFNWVTGRMPDVFSDSFESFVKEFAASKCSRVRGDPNLLGYFIDNEVRWGPDWRSDKHLLDEFLLMPREAAGKNIAVETLLEAFNNDISLLNMVLDTSISSRDELLDYTGGLKESPMTDRARVLFVEKYAERYFSITTSILRNYDPDHLILGNRIAGLPSTEESLVAFRIMSKYVDVISINIYNLRSPPVSDLRKLYRAAGKPFLITEYSFRARDSGLPNTRGAGLIVDTQRERALLIEEFITELIREPYIIGYHWFQYMDQPAEGRFDGENSNFGLVTISDEPYSEVVEAFKRVNRNAEKIHMS